jgi:hypothetical protein
MTSIHYSGMYYLAISKYTIREKTRQDPEATVKGFTCRLASPRLPDLWQAGRRGVYFWHTRCSVGRNACRWQEDSSRSWSSTTPLQVIPGRSQDRLPRLHWPTSSSFAASENLRERAGSTTCEPCAAASVSETRARPPSARRPHAEYVDHHGMHAQYSGSGSCRRKQRRHPCPALGA